MEYLTIREVAEKLKMSEKTIMRFIEKGGLQALKVGHQWRVDSDTLTKWLEGKHE